MTRTLLALAALSLAGIAPPLFGRTQPDIRGAVSVLPVPWGMVSLGGHELRQRTAGKANWESLFSVPRDSLYRVAAHSSGKLLAVWEKDPSIHLFLSAKKQHLRFPKPVPPSPNMVLFSVDSLSFSPDGRSAIVYMHDLPPRPPQTTTAYRYDLSNPGAAPKQLFSQAGFLVYSSGRTAVMAIPKDPTKSCEWRGCFPMAEIRGWELSDSGAVTSKTLRSGEGNQMESAQLVPATDENQVAILAEDRQHAVCLLRWGYGKEKAECQPLTWRPSYCQDPCLVTRNGDLVEAKPKGWGLTIDRSSADGRTQTQSYPPLPRRLKMTDTGGIKALKERANGELVVHWSDYLLLPGKKNSRLMLLVTPLGEHEWAAADIYLPSPEALFVGAERGGTRDFYRLPFGEIEKLSKPWQ